MAFFFFVSTTGSGGKVVLLVSSPCKNRLARVNHFKTRNTFETTPIVVVFFMAQYKSPLGFFLLIN